MTRQGGHHLEQGILLVFMKCLRQKKCLLQGVQGLANSLIRNVDVHTC
jgi:hypothetical protein